MILANSFSLQMLDLEKHSLVEVTPLTMQEVKELLGSDFVSAVGHQDTAGILSGILEVNVPFNRINVTLTPGDVLIVAQLTGGRLPEGSTTLPDGIEFKFLKVVLVAQL